MKGIFLLALMFCALIVSMVLSTMADAAPSYKWQRYAQCREIQKQQLLRGERNDRVIKCYPPQRTRPKPKYRMVRKGSR